MLHDLSIVAAAPRRPRVHFILNSKGGVGKSFIGTIIVQREQARGRPIRCFDGDATTATLSSFPALERHSPADDARGLDHRCAPA